MTQDILHQNLTALAGAYPDLARSVPRYRALPETPPLPAGDEDALPISLLTEPEPHVIVLGCREDIPFIWDRIRPLNGRLFVVEKNVANFHRLLSLHPLSTLLAAKECEWMMGLSPREVAETLRKAPPTMGPACIVSPVLDNKDASYYTEVRQALEPVILHREINRQFTLDQRGLSERNLIENLHFIAKSTPIGKLRDALKNVPAYIIGAGPSLDRNKDELKKVNDRAFLIAVDTALGPLIQSEITPHVVITVDPRELVFEHFRSIPSLDSTALVFSPSSSPQVLQRYREQARPVSLNPGDFMLLNRLHTCLDMGEPVPRGYMVGHHAFNVARHLGCSPLILVGMDLAFPAEGRSHCAGAALARSSAHQEHKITLGSCESVGSESTDAISVPGIAEPEVCTTSVFFNYLKRLEAEIEKTVVPVFDATEGGARKQGTTPLRLNEIVKKYVSDENIQTRFETAIQSAPVALTDSEAFNREIRRYQSITERGVLILQQLLQECQTGAVERCLLRFTSFLRDRTIETVADSFVQYLRYRAAKLRFTDHLDAKALENLLMEALDGMRLFSSALSKTR